MKYVSLGKVDYLNCFPIYYPIEQKIISLPVDIVKGTPAKLNSEYSLGRLDITPISSIEYIRNYHNSLILPHVSISAIGRVDSIILFSKYPIEELTGKKIALTVSSSTSVVLLKIILSRLVQVQPEYLTAEPNLEKMMQDNDAALLIGDDALSAKLDSNDYYTYDLGELWDSLTKLPMVYALWVINKNTIVDYPEFCETIRYGFIKAKEWSTANNSLLIDKACKAYPYEPQLIKGYFNTIKYDLTEPYLEGLLRFYQYAWEIGAIPHQVDLQIWR